MEWEKKNTVVTWNTYLKYNPKAKGNGVTIIRQGSN